MSAVGLIHALETIAPVLAVYGNVDPLDGLLPRKSPSRQAASRSMSATGTNWAARRRPGCCLAIRRDILVFGHTHRALIEREGKRLVINPGAAGPRRFDLKPSVAILQIADGRADVRIVPLTD